MADHETCQACGEEDHGVDCCPNVRRRGRTAWMCKGKTKRGKLCRGTPLRGSEYCGSHQDQRRLTPQSKKWTSIKAIPTEYRGILMRSRLEASFARALDRAGVSWVYEPRCFEGPEGRWLADFDTDRYGYVELKPFGPIGPPGAERQMMIEQQMARMAVARRTEPDALLTMIFWEYGRTLANIPLLLQNRQGTWSVTVGPNAGDQRTVGRVDFGGKPGLRSAS